MRINRRGLLTGSTALLASSKARAWFPHGSPSSSFVDTLLVPLLGDSNSGSGQHFNATYDTTRTILGQINHLHNTVIPSQEPLDLLGMGANDVGPTSRLCQFLIDNGHVPAGVVRIIM